MNNILGKLFLVFPNSKLQVNTKSYYRPEIDGLRALAVLAVIIYHLDGFLRQGFLGVDMFFVISGYVVSLSLINNHDTNWKTYLFAFYKRRIKRLMPAFLLCVLITSVFVALFISSGSDEINTTQETGLGSLFAVSNIVLYTQSLDYFKQQTELNLFTHAWSLGVEEQFYFIFPFLIGFVGLACIRKNNAHQNGLHPGAKLHKTKK